MRAVVVSFVLGVGLVAGCGGGGGDGDGGLGPDAMLPCGADLCAAIGASCGMAVDSCGDEVDCGTCTYTTETIGVLGVRPAIDVRDVEQVAFVETQPSFELQLAARGDGGWTTEPVAALAGPPLGPVDLAVGPDGTRWISFIDGQSQVRVASAPKGGSWVVSDPLGWGVAAAIALDSDGDPVVALGGVVDATTGVFVLEPDGDSGWTTTPVGDPTASGAPTGLDLVVQGREISLAWRDPGNEVVRYAFGKGATYTIEIVDPAVPAPRDPGALALAIDPAGRAHVIYGRGTQLVHAYRAGDVWHPSALTFDGADGDDALAIGLDGIAHAAAFDEIGLRAIDGVAGVFLSQSISTRCTDGTVDIAVSVDGAVHIVDACAGGIEYLRRAGPS
jgi:hypothetical protein